MELKDLKTRLTKGFVQYKYAVLILIVGLVLMLLPGIRGSSQKVLSQPAESAEKQDASARLEEILAQIQGAGRVRVLLSEAAGAQTVYQTDSDSSGDSSRLDTVIITNGDRAQNGLIQQVLPATYLGAIIVCEGGDRAEVRLAIAEAVSHFTGLGMDRISVLKMK